MLIHYFQSACRISALHFSLLSNLQSFTWVSSHGKWICFRETVKGDYYLYVMLCSGRASRSLQGAAERMSEENWCGWIFVLWAWKVPDLQVIRGFGIWPNRGTVSGLMQHTFLRREAGGMAERINKSGARSKVHHNVHRLWWNSQILFISTHAVCCRSGSLWFAHIVNALNKFPLQKMAAWIASHGKMGVLGDGLRDRTDRKKRRRKGAIGEWRRTDTLIIETIKSKNKSFFFYCEPFSR